MINYIELKYVVQLFLEASDLEVDGGKGLVLLAVRYDRRCWAKMSQLRIFIWTR